jgi:hypothetical protein
MMKNMDCRAKDMVVNPTIRIPAFAGMTPEGLLKGFAQLRNKNKPKQFDLLKQVQKCPYKSDLKLMP